MAQRLERILKQLNPQGEDDTFVVQPAPTSSQKPLTIHTSTGSLRGKTLFITGASRGIGLAVALKAARDGANVVIAAKTVTPHPKLPGTIYTAAKEIEQAGGRALPIQVDIRDEAAVQRAVDLAVETFGGIDIVVNNASAIWWSETEDTTMKKFDLMQSVNGRGTFLTTKLCLPYLKRASNPHILTMSPPLNMDPSVISGRIAYMMSKYNMSMTTLGWATELKGFGIATNSLWPRVPVITAAITNNEKFFGEISQNVKRMRTTEIMADAAYMVLTQPSRKFTGHFLLDEDVLRASGVTDFSCYRADRNAAEDSLIRDIGAE